MSDMTSVFAEITKSTPQDDGSLLVYGKATGSDLDLDEQRCDAAWLSTAMPEWFRTAGNVREQHDAKRAVGKAIEHEATTDGSHMIRARIVDPIAKAKVEAGILTGFSIGIKSPRIAKSADAKNGMIVGGQVIEVSLVDRPCLPTATLTMCKAAHAGWEGSPADLDEDLGLVKCEELTVDESVDKTTDVDHLEAPAPGQTCADCNEDGHLMCSDKAADVVAPVEDILDKAADESEEVFEVEKSIDEAQRLADEVLKAVEGAADEITVVGFDREAAIALVKSAADGLGQDESGDISGADQAIALIAQLVISEAQDLAKMPAQGCDIHLLMSAVDALRCFSKREQIEQGGLDPDNMVLLAAEGDAEKAEVVKAAKYSAEQKRQMLADGHAMEGPDGKPDYPIGDEEDLKNAIHAVGRGKGDHSKIRAYIKNRAKEMGKISEIPAYWVESGLAFAAEADTSKAVEPDAEKAEGAKAHAVDDVATLAAALKVLDGRITELDAELAQNKQLLKAFVGDDLTKDLLEKTATADSGDKEDSPLRELIKSVAVESSTEIAEASAKSAAEAVRDDLGARLEKVESMATPGGPALRRTEADRNQARRTDLVMESARFKALAASSDDPDLRKGYGAKAAQLEAQIKAL
jgi:hypothetical protein